MAEEIFTIQVPYNGITIPVEIPNKRPDGPDNADHEVWINGEHVFTIEPHLDSCDEPCWKLKREFKGVNLEFVSNIGMEIERHYL